MILMERILAKHDPVMLEEVLAALSLKPGGVAVDGTLGLGGHSWAIIQAITPGGTLVATEWDETMLVQAREHIGKPADVTVHLLHDDFRHLGLHLLAFGLSADGILLDLGLNSAQVEDPSRGISFMHDGPLDMRMDRSSGESASSLLNRSTPYQIETILKTYGDENWAKRIAQKIVERRRENPLRTTQDLVECVLAAIPVAARDQRIHPATRTFQAIRIAVNGELEGLDQAIRRAAGCLALNGRLAILSYHSGEDRIVKHVFRELAEEGFIEMTKKPVTPQPDEISRNPRSRSAKMRVLQRATG